MQVRHNGELLDPSLLALNGELYVAPAISLPARQRDKMTWSRRRSFKRGHVEKQQRTETSTHDTLAEELKRYIQLFRADGSQSLRLKSQKTDETGGLDKQTASETIERNRLRLAEMQERRYATGHWVVLLILHGLDAAGRDSAIKHVFTGVDPQGVDVASFIISSTLELHRDFLWRATLPLPERGRLGILNHSYYEECLTVRVRRQLLAKELIPSQLVTRNVWRERGTQI